jgi:hypothetical protein
MMTKHDRDESRVTTSVTVLQRRVGWVVAINGSVRFFVDWYVSEDRALDAALQYAKELDHRVVAMVGKDGATVFIGPEGDMSGRYSMVA